MTGHYKTFAVTLIINEAVCLLNIEVKQSITNFLYVQPSLLEKLSLLNESSEVGWSSLVHLNSQFTEVSVISQKDSQVLLGLVLVGSTDSGLIYSLSVPLIP